MRWTCSKSRTRTPNHSPTPALPHQPTIVSALLVTSSTILAMLLTLLPHRDAATQRSDDDREQPSQTNATTHDETATARHDLEERVAQRTRELTAAFEFSQQIVAQTDLTTLLWTVTERARLLTGALATSLCILDESGTTLELVSQSGTSDLPPPLRQPLDHGLSAQVVGAGQTVVIESACASCRFLRAYPARHCAAVPLRTGTSTLGALCVVRDAQHHFDNDQTHALALLANAAAIAITNARLSEAGRQQAEQAAALAERERLAADLHDHLAQTLGYLNLTIDRVRDLTATGGITDAQHELTRMKTAVGTAYSHVRSALAGLREPLPAATDLSRQLDDLIAEYRATTNITVELHIAENVATTLAPAAQTQILHIVREALTNVRRHAQAQHAHVTIEQCDEHVHITIADDGRGFDAHAPTGNNHLGLMIMQTRAERSGGGLRIDTCLGGGTRITASFPLFTKNETPVTPSEPSSGNEGERSHEPCAHCSC